MATEDDELLADLLLRWDELREQGQDVSSIELCQTCPHLVDELERRIRALKASDWMDRPIELNDPTVNGNPTTHEPKTLVGRYRLDVLIAEGGFAQVWRAYDLELHRNVAVKLPKPSRLDSTDAFIAEARRVARLTSIEALRGMPLELIELHGNPITDLSPLIDSTLNTLNARETKIEDWSALRSMLSLRIVWLDFVKDRDSEVLKSISTLAEINGQSVQGFWKSIETPSSYDEAVELGDLHFDQHQYDVALKHYSTAIGFDSTKAHAFVKRGECHFHLEAYKDSLSDFKQAVELEPNNPLYLDKLANANFHIRQFGDAIAAMEKAIALNPPEVARFKSSLATMLSNRAFSSSQEKRFSDAIADLNKALELDPDSKSYHRLRASCYYNSGDYERALPDFNEAIHRDPTNSSYYTTRGYCLNALRRNQEAEKDFKKAEELGRK